MKFDNEITVADTALTSKTTTVKVTGFPEDYEPEYSVEGDSSDITCDGANITWKDALAGKYTLTINDKSGVYALFPKQKKNALTIFQMSIRTYIWQ